MKKRVAIVGAGASGIPAAKEALEHGMEPVVFEQSDDIGGLWRFKPEETDEPSVMKSTVINSSKEMTAYSTFVPPPHFANFMHNRRMLDYLRLYANSFQFSRYLRLQHTVLNVRREPNHAESGKWIVHYQEPDGFEHEQVFDAVLLCTGHHTWPYWPPKWPGQAEFRGRISHAHSYKDHHGFDDQIVVVVGVGNSGVDIAVELSRIAAEVHLATRRGTWVLHRNLDRSVPFDIALNTRWPSLLRRTIPIPASWTNGFMYRGFECHRLDHEKFGLKPKHGILSAHLTVNDELPNRLSCGTVRVRPNIREFTRDGLIFEDGTRLPKVDHVILATGYTFEFPLAEGGKLIPVQENDVNLYLNIFPLALSEHNTFGVIGLIQPLGSIMPISEMQSRLFFGALAGAVRLPGRARMEAHIACAKARVRARYVQSRRHTIQVDFVDYMDELAAMVGCAPPLWDYALTDLALFRALLFGPNLPYVYRLHGPGKWDGARQAILTVGQRVEAGMRGVPLEDNNLCPQTMCPKMCSSRSKEIPSELVRAFFAFIFSLIALACTLWIAKL